MNCNCSIFWGLKNLQEQVKKAFCCQKLFWPFTVWIDCSSDLKSFENSQPLASNFKSFSQSLEYFFLTLGQNNFGNKMPLLISSGFHFEKKKCWSGSGCDGRCQAVIISDSMTIQSCFLRFWKTWLALEAWNLFIG